MSQKKWKKMRQIEQTMWLRAYYAWHRSEPPKWRFFKHRKWLASKPRRRDYKHMVKKYVKEYYST